MLSLRHLALCAAIALPSPVVAQDANSAATPAKLASLMEQGGFKGANRVNDNVWTIDYSGNQLAKFKVIVAMNDRFGGLISIFVNPVTRAQLPLTSATMSTMLKANYNPYVKVGIDADGDSFVRADVPATTDGVFFKSMVERVALETDSVYGQLKPMLK
jgi:hypothetical protein